MPFLIAGIRQTMRELRCLTASHEKGHIMASKPITSDTFDSAVSSGKPVLVDFWASWCGPCRAMGPVVEQISDEMSSKLEVYKCNVDEEPTLAQRFNIVSIPTLILFKDGKPAQQMVGAMPKSALSSELEAAL